MRTSVLKTLKVSADEYLLLLKISTLVFKDPQQTAVYLTLQMVSFTTPMVDISFNFQLLPSTLHNSTQCYQLKLCF